jgi:hypothetical protein
VIPGPNGCTCGFNGDCNCPYEASGRYPVNGPLPVLCGHGKPPQEWCETCDGDVRDDQVEGNELDEACPYCDFGCVACDSRLRGRP